MIDIILGVLTSGAGGGIIGGILGLFKQAQERKERIEVAKFNLERDRLEYENAEKERNYRLAMYKKGADIDFEKVQTEAEREIDVSHMEALSNAQEVFKNLKTSVWMDNFRASVRWVLAYWAATLFSIALIWSFYEYRGLITPESGKNILIDLLSTLTFVVTSIVTFYYIARRNKGPK